MAQLVKSHTQLLSDFHFHMVAQTLEEGMTTHSSILGESHGPAGYSIGSQRVGCDRSNFFFVTKG